MFSLLLNFKSRKPSEKQFRTKVFSKILKIGFSFALLFVLSDAAIAQDLAAGAAAIDEAATGIETFFEPITNIVYAIATIIAILGAIRVYTKWTMGDPDVMSTAAGWFGSAIFLIAAIAVVQSFFGAG